MIGLSCKVFVSYLVLFGFGVGVLGQDPSPTEVPTSRPTSRPTSQPTSKPSSIPTTTPSGRPSAHPTVFTHAPTFVPTAAPSTTSPTGPSALPTYAPFFPFAETEPPTFRPTCYPTFVPSEIPSAVPTDSPTESPSTLPTATPTAEPTATPTYIPSTHPTFVPTFTASPTVQPSIAPSRRPTGPTMAPSILPQSISFTVSQVLTGITATTYNAKQASNDAVMASSVSAISPAVSATDIDFSAATSIATGTTDATSQPAGQLRGTTTTQQVHLQQDSCLLTYVINVPNTASVGFVNGDSAFEAISLQLETAADDGMFTNTIRRLANSGGVSDMTTVATDAVVTSNYESGAPYSATSSAKEPLNGGVIAGIVLAVFVFAVVLCCGFYQYRVMKLDHAKARDRIVNHNVVSATAASAADVKEGSMPDTAASTTEQRSNSTSSATSTMTKKAPAAPGRAKPQHDYVTEMTVNPLFRAHSTVRRRKEEASAADTATDATNAAATPSSAEAASTSDADTSSAIASASASASASAETANDEAASSTASLGGESV